LCNGLYRLAKADHECHLGLVNREYAGIDKDRRGKGESADNPASAAERHRLFPRQPLKIIEDCGNQLLPSGIVCG
jgi:hypothetical protein